MSIRRKPHFTYEFESESSANNFYDSFRFKYRTVLSEVDGFYVKFVGTGSINFDIMLRQYADTLASENGGRLIELVNK